MATWAQPRLVGSHHLQNVLPVDGVCVLIASSEFDSKNLPGAKHGTLHKCLVFSSTPHQNIGRRIPSPTPVCCATQRYKVFRYTDIRVYGLVSKRVGSLVQRKKQLHGLRACFDWFHNREGIVPQRMANFLRGLQLVDRARGKVPYLCFEHPRKPRFLPYKICMEHTKATAFAVHLKI